MDTDNETLDGTGKMVLLNKAEWFRTGWIMESGTASIIIQEDVR